jgi:hypothetical protein
MALRKQDPKSDIMEKRKQKLKTIKTESALPDYGGLIDQEK